MSEKKFPYKGWVLTPGFNPVEKTFTRSRTAYANEYHAAESGRNYHIEEIHPDKASAIAFGRADLDRQQAVLEKKQANIEKRRAALDKAAA